VKLFEYEVGDITGKDPMQKHEFWDNNHKKIIYIHTFIGENIGSMW